MAGQLPSAKQKAELRTAVLNKRDGLTPQIARAASQSLCERLCGLEPLRHLTAVAGYASIRNEIDASGFLSTRLDEGAAVYFPRVSGPQSMEFVPVDSLEELSPGSFGVPEPDGEPAPIGDIELFLVPGAAFDRQGHRLGFGRGYYDRALERALSAGRAGQASADLKDPSDSEHLPDSGRARGKTPLIVGICYHWQLLEGEIPVEPHDISMDVIATEEETIWCRQGRST